jgi:hypothetical protein
MKKLILLGLFVSTALSAQATTWGFMRARIEFKATNEAVGAKVNDTTLQNTSITLTTLQSITVTIGTKKFIISTPALIANSQCFYHIS